MQPVGHVDSSNRFHGAASVSTGVALQPPAWGAGRWRDWLGVVASIGCAIHCAAMPFVIGFLPMLGLSFLADPAFHQWMVAICLAIALVSFVPGFRHHRRWEPSFVAVMGLSLIAFAAFAGEDNCCAHGEESNQGTEVAVAASGSKSHIASENGVQKCSLDGCAGCSKPSDTAAEADFQTAGAMGFVWPWLTPLGGILLVSAHLRNRYWICRCGCATNCSVLRSS